MAELCDVERILKTRYRKGQKECLVKWKGWSSEHNTWEPEQNVVRPTMVLSNGDLKERLHDMKGLLSNIAEGSVVTERRKSYQQGSRRSFDIDNGLALLPDDQEHVMMDTLMSMFPMLALKNMDFIVRVLLPEAIFTIYSQVTSEALEDMPERTQNSGDDFSEENSSTGDEWIPEINCSPARLA
ncbi:chromodomain Y-like protein [Littorina saxatilis]|uniref:chromodomain Y-like protein n=1 Tax=Littorina saxatilis TaxID=31220 RepID=UPI0038B4E35F